MLNTLFSPGPRAAVQHGPGPDRPRGAALPHPPGLGAAGGTFSTFCHEMVDPIQTI